MKNDRLEEMTVNAVILRYPEAIPVFARFGIDACCGGPRTVQDAASRHGIDLDALTTALRAVGATEVGALALNDREQR